MVIFVRRMVLGRCMTAQKGELYNLNNDPGALVNLWGDPERQSLKRELIADLGDHLPTPREPRLVRRTPV